MERFGVGPETNEVEGGRATASTDTVLERAHVGRSIYETWRRCRESQEQGRRVRQRTRVFRRCLEGEGPSSCPPARRHRTSPRSVANEELVRKLSAGRSRPLLTASTTSLWRVVKVLDYEGRNRLTANNRVMSRVRECTRRLIPGCAR